MELEGFGFDEVKKTDINSLPLVDSYDGFAPCVCKKSVGKFICIGLNYADHAKESGLDVPPEPVIFSKATSAIIGPNDDVEIPRFLKGEVTAKEVRKGIKDLKKQNITKIKKDIA